MAAARPRPQRRASTRRGAVRAVEAVYREIVGPVSATARRRASRCGRATAGRPARGARRCSPTRSAGTATPSFAEFFDWKHAQNPFGASPAWVAVAGRRDRRLPHLPALAVRAPRRPDPRTRCARSTPRPSPAHQGRGIFRRLTMTAVDELTAEGVDFVFNTPNANSRPGYLRMGWSTVGRLPLVVAGRRDRRARCACAPRASPAERWPVATDAGRRGRRRCSPTRASHDLLAAIGAARAACARRAPPEYLRWRYGLAALGYRALALDDDPAAGLAVFRLRRRGRRGRGRGLRRARAGRRRRGASAACSARSRARPAPTTRSGVRLGRVPLRRLSPVPAPGPAAHVAAARRPSAPPGAARSRPRRSATWSSCEPRRTPGSADAPRLRRRPRRRRCAAARAARGAASPALRAAAARPRARSPAAARRGARRAPPTGTRLATRGGAARRAADWAALLGRVIATRSGRRRGAAEHGRSRSSASAASASRGCRSRRRSNPASSSSASCSRRAARSSPAGSHGSQPRSTARRSSAATPLVVHPLRAGLRATPHDGRVRAAGLALVGRRRRARAPAVGAGAARRRSAPDRVAGAGRDGRVLRRRPRARTRPRARCPSPTTSTSRCSSCAGDCAPAAARSSCVPDAVVVDHRPVASPARADRAGRHHELGAWRAYVEAHGPALHPRGRSAAAGRAAHRAHRRRAVGEGRAPLGRLAPRRGIRPRAAPPRASSSACRPSTTPTTRGPVVRRALRRARPRARCAARPARPTCCGSSATRSTVTDRGVRRRRSRAGRVGALRRRAPDAHAHAGRGDAAGDRRHPVPARAAADRAHAHDVAVVAKSRDVFRSSVADAIAGGIRPAIYGSGWEPFVDPDARRAPTTSPNEELPGVYSSVGVLLNDHWQTMHEWGFVSNRLFDALACETPVISDDLPEIAELFDGAVLTYRDPAELRELVDAALSPIRRAARARAARGRVLDRRPPHVRPPRRAAARRAAPPRSRSVRD